MKTDDLELKGEVIESFERVEKYKLQKHHPDYSQPFYVITLCDKCHKDIHTNVRRLKNGI